MNAPHLNLVQMAGMLARDPDFQEWVSYYSVPPRIVGSDEAAQFIRDTCKVRSRRELADDDAAVQRFHSLIRKPFVAWKERRADTSRG